MRDTPAAAAVLLGFHGYMEHAAIQMDRLASIPASDAWTLVSVQGLHRFYKGRSEEVVASWMTRQDREEMIADNIEYASRVIERIVPVDVPLITVGFSQGVAMAFRAGMRARRRADAIIAVGGDVPPELLADESARFPPLLLCRGEADEWYTREKLQNDLVALGARGTPPEVLEYPGGHEWTAPVASAAAALILRIVR